MIRAVEYCDYDKHVVFRAETIRPNLHLNIGGQPVRIQYRGHEVETTLAKLRSFIRQNITLKKLLGFGEEIELKYLPWLGNGRFQR